MAAQPAPEIVLYDLACTKNICFSPTVWRIRLILNYKQIPYTTTFLEFQDIEPTLSALGIPPNPTPPTTTTATAPKRNYTVPAIHHLPTNTHLMDSAPIAAFLETTYPSPPLAPSTPQTTHIEAQLRAIAGPVLYKSLVPRELLLLAPAAQAYFRRTREADLGLGLAGGDLGGKKRLEDLLVGEEEAWEAAGEGLRAVDGLVRAARDGGGGGKFVGGGERPGLADFFVAGSLQCVRTVDEGVFGRFGGLEGLVGVWEACWEWMERDT